MKVRVKQSSGGFSPWIIYAGDPLTAVMASPYISDGGELPEFEMAFSTMDEVRQERDRLITETDWTQTLDCPLPDEKKTEFLAYRQSLRDIPQTYTNPDDVVWPTKPTI